jgi:pre-mRNA-processing factor 40
LVLNVPGQLHDKVLKQATDEKRRAERKLRHLQDDLRYALKKLPEPLDVNLPYEEVRIRPSIGREFV